MNGPRFSEFKNLRGHVKRKLTILIFRFSLIFCLTWEER